MWTFRWHSTDSIPPAIDLRRRGWALLDAADRPARRCPVLVEDFARAGEMLGAIERAATILVGVDDSYLRAHALSVGFGEAVASTISLNELEQRAQRVAIALEAQPRRRRHGALELDLLLRDGLVDGRRLCFHPREFGLLWRLAQAPGEPVSPQQLLTEVWRINFRPETNSLAVHICRLRAKLASVGLAGIVSTTPEGCYSLVTPRPGPASLALAGPLPDGSEQFSVRQPP